MLFRSKKYKTKLEKIGTSYDAEKIQLVANSKYKKALLARLNEFDGNPKKAFGGRNAPNKNPIYVDYEKTITLPEKVKLVWFDDNYTIRKEITSELKIEKVIGVGIQNILQKRLNAFNGDKKKAFLNLDGNPIWLNKEKNIAINRDRKSTRLNSSHIPLSRMPSSA